MIVVVGKRQSKSKRLNCGGCRALLEFQEGDVRRAERGLLFVDCPKKGCRYANYLGTDWRGYPKDPAKPPKMS